MPKTDHFAFRVSDLDASIRFYTESLGLRLLFRNVNREEGEAYGFLDLEGGNLELIQTIGAPYNSPAIEPPYCPHLALETDDLAGVLARIRAAGIRVVKGPLEIVGKEKWLYISDPDNNVIEYIQWVAKDKH